MNDRARFLADLGLFEMPPVECKPWCRDRDGHPGQTAREDQVCGTIEATMSLRHMQDEPEGDPQWNFLSTYVEQSPEENPTVHIGVGDSSGLTLTLDESVLLALARAGRVRPTPGCRRHVACRDGCWRAAMSRLARAVDVDLSDVRRKLVDGSNWSHRALRFPPPYPCAASDRGCAGQGRARCLPGGDQLSEASIHAGECLPAGWRIRRLKWWQADQLAIELLGLHPMLVWGDAWSSRQPR